MALVNARLSDKSIKGWSKRQKSAKSLFGAFQIILAANLETANGLSWLLEHEIECAGNLKDAAPQLPVNMAELKKLKKQIGNRPVWCAASTHEGEEEIIIAAHNEIRQSHPDALLILALRHPRRRSDVTPLLSGSKYVIRSEGKPTNRATSVLLFDTILSLIHI